MELLHYKGKKSISLKEFCDYVRDNVDFSDDCSIKRCAPYLGMLGNNRKFLSDYIISSLRRGIARFEESNEYTPPSVVLAEGNRYLIRANLWVPPRIVSEAESINLYGMVHDHNFSFLTLSYFGPGYRSRMWTYDYSKVSGYVGECVDLKPNGIMQLRTGQMYLYRKNVDVHSQLYPESESITINVMSKVDYRDQTYQFIFDEKKNTITGVYGGFHSQKHVLDIARSVKTDRCQKALSNLSEKTSCSRTRDYLCNH